MVVRRVVSGTVSGVISGSNVIQDVASVIIRGGQWVNHTNGGAVRHSLLDYSHGYQPLVTALEYGRMRKKENFLTY